MVDVRASLRKMRALSAVELSTTVLAAFLLPICCLAIRVFGVSRILEFTRQTPVAEMGQVPSLAVLKRRGYAVGVAGRHLVFPALCLPQSIVLAWLLRRGGSAAVVRIGVKLVAGRLLAHAWVECEGIPVNARAEIAVEFAAFDDVVPLAAFRE
jgi:hypothetical protein